MALKLVPFNEKWITHDKIDVHAIYRRPRWVEDAYGEMVREYDANGVPTWDLTGPLPVKQHNRWKAKGFEYVTLANRESLSLAARKGTLPPGMRAADFDQHQTGGPWNYRKYAEGVAVEMTDAADRLKSMVEKYGWEQVEEIRKQDDPAFTMPEALKAQPVKAKKGAAA